MTHNVIGIDPDSLGCVAALANRSGDKPRMRSFSFSHNGLEAMTQFIRSVPDCLIGIEGRRGQSSPLEEHLREEGITFYSVPAAKIDGYRNAVVSANKNNENDALAVARFLLDAESRGELELYLNTEELDFELRMVSRARLRLVQEITEHANVLWKLLKHTANDLYLALLGKGDDQTSKPKITSKRLLRLIVAMPELSSWKNLKEDDLLKLSSSGKIRGWENWVAIVQATRHLSHPIPAKKQLLLKQTAETLLLLLGHKEQQEKMLEQMVEERPLAKALRDHYKGMGSSTASLIIEEMITPLRFPDDDHLASYAGLTKRDHSTGTNNRQVHTSHCNKRLKYAFLNLAKGFLNFNKDHHLTKYRLNLVKKGMSKMESLMRTARALVRDVYRFLKQEMKKEQAAKNPPPDPEAKEREPVAKDTKSQGQMPYKQHEAPKKNVLPTRESVQLEAAMT